MNGTLTYVRYATGLPESWMARYGLSNGATKPRREQGKPTALKWTVVAVIGAYGAALGLGLFLYGRMVDTPAANKETSISKNEQIGRIFIITPDGCRSGRFDNSSGGGYSLSPRSCDELHEKVGTERRPQPDAIEAVHRYFHRAN